MGLNHETSLIYRTMGNDTHVTVGGMTKTTKSSIRTRSKSVFIETFKLIRYSEESKAKFASFYSTDDDEGS